MAQWLRVYTAPIDFQHHSEWLRTTGIQLQGIGPHPGFYEHRTPSHTQTYIHIIKNKINAFKICETTRDI